MNRSNNRLGLRRLRNNPLTRELVRDVRVSHEQFIQPYFVAEGISAPEAVSGMPGVFRETPASLIDRIAADMHRGVNKIMLFGVPAAKRLRDFDFGFTAAQVAAIRDTFADKVWIAADVCLCSATEHGHCGILNAAGDHVVNDATVGELARAAVEYARAGADCVAPSDMMDGRVGAIRGALDAEGLETTLIMSYAAKFNSAFYGPFREAADSTPRGHCGLGDRSTYQIDPANAGDALASALRDADEGADILMVKPGLPYLDILSRLSNAIPDKPWAAYQVSGEHAGIELLAANGLADGPRAHVEAWHALTRAGAGIIISYGARSAREWLQHYRH